MHIHPPKPLHGWKEFLNEIFVIVVGVLIALGFEQVVEELHWQHKVHEGEERLDAELRGLYRAAVLQVALAPCLTSQYTGLEQRVLDGGANLVPAPFIPLSDRLAFTHAAPPAVLTRFRQMQTPVWDTLNADGTILHMPLQEQRRLGVVYAQAKTYIEAGTQLKGLSEFTLPLQLDTTVRYELISKIHDTRDVHFKMTNAAVLLAAFVKEMGHAPGADETSTELREDQAASIAACERNGYPLANWKDAIAKQPSLTKLGY